ncbi:MAG: FecR domain-containing protein [Vulcanimicrobiaceae bacterium]
MQRLLTATLAAVFVLTQAPHAAPAVMVKTLVRISGDVGYQQSASSAYIPITGQQEIPDNGYVVTKAGGVADLVMPDSSVIRIAQAASIQVGAFHPVGSGGENQITVYNGSFRFKVQHPAGGVSNYKFQTPTSQIAVRGTEGLGKVTQDVTQVSNTLSTTPNDVQVAASKMQTSYLPATASLHELRSFLRNGDPLDEIKLAEMAPEQRLIAQVQVVFTAVAQGFTATVTVNGVVVGQYVLSAGALGVGGTLSTAASGAAGAAGSSAISAGTSAASAAGAAGTAVVTGAAAAAAAGGLAAAAASANSGITAATATPTPTPSPTASVGIIITGHSPKKAPESAPAPASTPPPLPAPGPAGPVGPHPPGH